MIIEMQINGRKKCTVNFVETYLAVYKAGTRVGPSASRYVRKDDCNLKKEVYSTRKLLFGYLHVCIVLPSRVHLTGIIIMIEFNLIPLRIFLNLQHLGICSKRIP